MKLLFVALIIINSFFSFSQLEIPEGTKQFGITPGFNFVNFKSSSYNRPPYTRMDFNSTFHLGWFTNTNVQFGVFVNTSARQSLIKSLSNGEVVSARYEFLQSLGPFWKEYFKDRFLVEAMMGLRYEFFNAKPRRDGGMIRFGIGYNILLKGNFSIEPILFLNWETKTYYKRPFWMIGVGFNWLKYKHQTTTK
jgi:hypothetical protein